jgi:hypothetical protein
MHADRSEVGEEDGEDYNAWMTHRSALPKPHGLQLTNSLFNNQPLAQWITDRQQAFQDFSRSHQPKDLDFLDVHRPLVPQLSLETRGPHRGGLNQL